MRRRALLAAALMAAVGGPRLAEASTGERESLLACSEEALARGDVQHALAAFERAESMLHAADTEMSLVRAYMQAGEYRRALAFAAHMAGAHREVAAGAVLYARLLAIGGQGAAAQRVLDGAFATQPGDAPLGRMRERLLDPALELCGPLLAPPLRLAPYGTGIDVPARMRVVASGVLVDGGRRALVPLAALPSRAPALRVRNGLGHTAEAHVERRLAGSGLALLKLDPALTGAVAVADRDPFPGSPAHAVEFTASSTATPAWPWLRSGFHGMPDIDAALCRLGVEMPAGPRGGPVFDARGRLAGIAIVDRASARDLLLPVARLRRELGELLGDPAISPPAERAAIDAIFEQSLGVTLQLIAPASRHGTHGAPTPQIGHQPASPRSNSRTTAITKSGISYAN